MNPLRWLYVAVALIMLGGGAYGVYSYRTMAAQAARVAPLEQKVSDLESNYQTLSREAVRRAEFDSVLRQARVKVSTKLDKVQREDPAAAAYLGQRIPDSVRSAYADAQQR